MKNKTEFSKMSRGELLEYCRKLYQENGISALSYPEIKKIPKLYFNLYSNSLSQKTLLSEFGLDKEYKNHISSSPYKYGDSYRDRWTWETLIEKIKSIKEKEGRLPPALWFQKSGHASLVFSLYNLGHTWAELREAVGDFSDSNFVQSRNRLRWLSHAEASLSNFLYARGIDHKKGERYDDSFADLNVTKYAFMTCIFLEKMERNLMLKFGEINQMGTTKKNMQKLESQKKNSTFLIKISLEFITQIVMKMKNYQKFFSNLLGELSHLNLTNQQII